MEGMYGEMDDACALQGGAKEEGGRRRQPQHRAAQAAEAQRQAEVEGLVLARSEQSTTGFKGVFLNKLQGGKATYFAQICRGGSNLTIGRKYSSPEEGALALARFLREHPQQRAHEGASTSRMSRNEAAERAAEALRQAQAEGLELVRSEQAATGFKGVHENPSKREGGSARYRVQHYRDGRTLTIGRCTTAEEGALVYARYLRDEGLTADVKPELPAVEVSAEGAAAIRQAETEGLELIRSQQSNCGYLGVRHLADGQYVARLCRKGKQEQIGVFETAEEASLAHARHRRKEHSRAAHQQLLVSADLSLCGLEVRLRLVLSSRTGRPPSRQQTGRNAHASAHASADGATGAARLPRLCSHQDRGPGRKLRLTTRPIRRSFEQEGEGDSERGEDDSDSGGDDIRLPAGGTPIRVGDKHQVPQPPSLPNPHPHPITPITHSYVSARLHTLPHTPKRLPTRPPERASTRASPRPLFAHHLRLPTPLS